MSLLIYVLTKGTTLISPSPVHAFSWSDKVYFMWELEQVEKSNRIYGEMPQTWRSISEIDFPCHWRCVVDC